MALWPKGFHAFADPLKSADTLSCLEACRALGAVIEDRDDGWEIVCPIPRDGKEDVFIDVGNSGTSLYLLTAIAAALGRKVHFDGDEQIRRRSASNLLNALKDLGAELESAPGGCAPYWVKGPLTGRRNKHRMPYQPVSFGPAYGGAPSSFG